MKTVRKRMKLSKFKFKLPEELIAQYPARHRDESRLMFVNRETGDIEHHIFKDVLDFFQEMTCLFSTTPKFSCQALWKQGKTGANIEVFYYVN